MQVSLRVARLIFHFLRGIALAAVVFPRAEHVRQQSMVRDWSRRLLEICGVKLVVHPAGEVLEHSVMLVGNHVSWLDIYVISAWRPVSFVAKAEIQKWPILGWLAKTIGTVFIRRDKRSDALRIVCQLADALKSGERICIFPEGTTSDGIQLLPFHANLLQAPVSAMAAVQPICLMYEDAQGQQSLAPAYIGEISLFASLISILRAAPLTAHLYITAPLRACDDRRELARCAQGAVHSALRLLQQRLEPSPEAAVVNAEVSRVELN
ncbi:1-acyl-sn-glycerol-3-phosphate acyltransferase [Mycoavidus sp. B2-EB]|uniref:lysophospholipid acyltransferase family protein n=1 Tax=Mycoavidus sp. B2-EB TaxID=2651972 RepID=UPI0016245D82|nr:lysophospholipid acyltransferase family protein [Mycoavidus sp. B2-EB]BBO59317.1 1-acyl-sn-glycerol-3-phosphate acyltransferase [Mycoavidus sp. B2-EB]